MQRVRTGPIVRGLLFIVFLGFLFPLTSPWHILTLTQLLGFACVCCLVVPLCIAAFENYGLLAAVATVILTNVIVVVGWSFFRVLVTILIPKSLTPKSAEDSEED